MAGLKRLGNRPGNLGFGLGKPGPAFLNAGNVFLLLGHGHGATTLGLGPGHARIGFRLIGLQTGANVHAHVDIGDAIIQHIEQQVLFPDIDIRQKLTLQKEYGVAEFQLSRESSICGKTLRESGLREKDILVLNIQRGTLNIPNPKSTRQLLANDVLLCFGSLLAMRSLVHVGVVPHKLDTPPPPRRGRKRSSAAA